MSDESIPAFPMPSTVCEGHVFDCAQYGMSLRDYFAANAMQGLLANPQFARILKMMLDLPTSDTLHDVERSLAGGAYEYADAMLKEREK